MPLRMCAQTALKRVGKGESKKVGISAVIVGILLNIIAFVVNVTIYS
jgi:hypothetical protein